jgi:hypothetical protein
MISEIITKIFGNKQQEHSNSDEHLLTKNTEEENKKNKQSKNTSVDDRKFFEDDNMYMIRKHEENVANDSVFFPEYEATTVGEFTFYQKKVLTLSNTIFSPIEFIKNFWKRYLSNKNYAQPDIPDDDVKIRESNAKERESKTIASVQELEKVAQKYKKIKSKSAQNSSNENTQTQNQSKSQGLTL